MATLLPHEQKEHKELEEILDEEIDNVYESLTDEQIELEQEFKRFESMNKNHHQIRHISNKDILEAVTTLTSNLSLYINRNTVNINADSIKENLILKRLSAIKEDTSCLNEKSFKRQVLEYITFLLGGVCLGMLDNVWLPFITDFGGVLKEIFKFFFR